MDRGVENPKAYEQVRFSGIAPVIEAEDIQVTSVTACSQSETGYNPYRFTVGIFVCSKSNWGGTTGKRSSLCAMIFIARG